MIKYDIFLPESEPNQSLRKFFKSQGLVLVFIRGIGGGWQFSGEEILLPSTLQRVKHDGGLGDFAVLRRRADYCHIPS